MKSEQQFYHFPQKFDLEPGGHLDELTIGYHTYGQLNDAGDNVLWVCHALTADSDPGDWWRGVVGPDTCLNSDEYFIVCANILGSCYGTTGALSTNPETGEPYFGDFPSFTIRDMVRAHDLLRVHLGIEKIAVCLGGSCGGHQVLEYGVMFPDLIDKLIVLVTAATESAWRVAVHSAQRMSIEADSTWGDKTADAASKGLAAARGIGLLTYRTSNAFVKLQSEEDSNKLDDFKASSYIRYQGKKLVQRFSAYCYWQLTKALDTHHLGRDRGSIESALQGIKAKSLLISIDSDVLIPPHEQVYLADHIPDATLATIKSDYGHDGFLIEHEKISASILGFLSK